MARNTALGQYVGTAEQAREAVDDLVLDIKVPLLALYNQSYRNVWLFRRQHAAAHASFAIA